jgi:hypothetical protein
MLECCWYHELRERFKRLYRGTGGPTHPACMQRLMSFPNQLVLNQTAVCSGAAGSLDEHHQMPLTDLVHGDLPDEIW